MVLLWFDAPGIAHGRGDAVATNLEQAVTTSLQWYGAILYDPFSYAATQMLCEKLTVYTLIK